MSTTKTKPTIARQKTNVQTFFKVIKPTMHGLQVVADHLDYSEAETHAEHHPGSFIRFSSYQVHKPGTTPVEQPVEHPGLTAENSRVVSVFNVQEITEYSIDVIGVDLEYSQALQLQESRKSAVIEFSGYRRVPRPSTPEEPQQYRERRAELHNRANAIAGRLFMLPFLTVVGLAVLVFLKTMGVLS